MTPGPSRGPAPPILAPPTALGLLLSRALSSGEAKEEWRSPPRKSIPTEMAAKRKTSGMWGQSPRQLIGRSLRSSSRPSVRAARPDDSPGCACVLMGKGSRPPHPILLDSGILE